ncbi:MAG: S8 family serine peptidase [Candidatus Cryptobacteroides sp.]
MHKKLFICLGLTALVSGSCSVIEPESSCQETPDTAPLTKVVDFGGEHEEDTFLVKFNSVPDEAGIAALKCDGVTGIEKLFHSVPGKEGLEKEFGLDRWYIVTTDGQIPVESAVSRFAEIDAVSTVEYNSHVSKASDCVVYPYTGPEPATRAESTGLPFNDPSLIDQWHYINQGNATIATNVYKGADINVKDVWSQLTCGDPDIIIAVVDEGVKYTHPDLKGNMWVNKGEIPDNGIDDDGNGYVDDVYGYNFVSNGRITWDKAGDSGHGTHCAGTIAAVNNNNTGVSGVAGGSGSGDGCRIMSCQIFDGNGGGSVSSTTRAIKYAADMGASVISCSFGYSTAFSSDNQYISMVGSAEIDAIHYFEASAGNNSVLDGNIAIFAAGNEAHPYAHYPGAFADVISVSAFAPDFLPTYYTNFGPGCNIVAPGGEYYLGSSLEKSAVLSTLASETKGTDYGYMQGTSMACPHVSGIVALALSYAGKLGKTFTRSRFKEMLLTSANDFDSRLTGTKTYYNNYHAPLELYPFYHKMGTGSVDAWKLMMQIEGVPCLLAETGRKQWLDISDYFGTASVNLTYLGIEVEDGGKEALGLAEEPEIKYGRLYIHPTKQGSCKIRITAVGGGESLGGGSNPPGGMEISQEISVIARSFKSENGGWL